MAQFKWTVLNVSTFGYLIGLSIYTLLNYNTLAGSGGWGLLSRLGLTGIGLAVLFLDILMRHFLKNHPIALNVLGLIFAIIIGLLIEFQ